MMSAILTGLATYLAFGAVLWAVTTALSRDLRDDWVATAKRIGAARIALRLGAVITLWGPVLLIYSGLFVYGVVRAGYRPTVDLLRYRRASPPAD